MLTRDLMDLAGLQEAAHAASFDVDHSARAEADRGPRVVRGADRLVEADRGVDPALQRGVVEEVVVAERLFDHQQLEGVERLEQREVGQAVRRVRVDGDGNSRERPAYLRHRHDVPSRFDLQLHADVALRDVPAHLLHELVDRRRDPDRDAARHSVP